MFSITLYSPHLCFYSSLIFLSSTSTAVAAVRWALQCLIYPFPFVHLFKDLTVCVPPSVENSSQNLDYSDIVESAALTLTKMSAKVNFDRNRPRRQSTDEILKASGRDGILMHPTPVMAYAHHRLFEDALSLMHKMTNKKSRLTGCVVYDLDSNQVYDTLFSLKLIFE